MLQILQTTKFIGQLSKSILSKMQLFKALETGDFGRQMDDFIFGQVEIS